jgi:hypothetical protein
LIFCTQFDIEPTFRSNSAPVQQISKEDLNKKCIMWKFYAPFKFNQADFSAVLQLDVAAVCKRGGFIGDLLD